ncbi:uncharacterized protein CCOS01_16755 [Colletotrichum costaricense]|uniref:Uncharacterized protein n=1 Tax=Colletotrichum costaricense TaxID=1209916 RepID=A0AAI9YEW8_9PEZI|nr:uncharacterized protein CCOS01_16755 [Colletotrichum costaricense]KAK1505181.1 hypothetical protein CCOS01_16755 [Colletotrichum costaricense]
MVFDPFSAACDATQLGGTTRLQVPDPSPGAGSRNGTKRSKRGAGRKEGKDIADGYWTLDSPFLSDYGYGLDRVSEGTMHESTEALWERIADEYLWSKVAKSRVLGARPVWDNRLHKLLLFRRNAPESFEMRSSSEAYSPKVSS